MKRPPRVAGGAFVVLALCASVTLAQPPVRTVAQNPDATVIGPDELRKVGERLRAMQQLDPQLIEKLRKLLENNKTRNPEQLAEKLMQQNPELYNADRAGDS